MVLKELRAFFLKSHDTKFGFQKPTLLLVVSIISLPISLQFCNMTISSISSKHSLSWEELSNSTNSLSYSNDRLSLSPSLSPNHCFYLKYKPDFQRGNRNHKGELHQILWIGACLYISEVRGPQGRSHAAEQFWSDLRPGQWGACWVGNDHQPPAKCYRNFDEDSLAGSQRTPRGVHSLALLQNWSWRNIKCLINLGNLELVWQVAKKLFCLTVKRNYNTCQRGYMFVSQFRTQIISSYK